MKQAINDKVEGGVGRRSLQDQYPVDAILESKYCTLNCSTGTKGEVFCFGGSGCWWWGVWLRS